ncbi:MAG: mandelate racemase/muconate lactonizing enzyme family protein [Candidatus Bathyarchaeia archaeon]
MRIKKATFQVMRLPLAEPIRSARTPFRSTGLLSLDTDSGEVGWGEASPHSVAGQDLGRLGEALLNADPFDIRRILMQVSEQGLANAVETALYDLMGKSLQIPICTLLGGKYRERIGLTWVVTSRGDPEQRAKEALQFVERGFKEIKLKVGVDPKADLKAIEAMRELIGEDINIRVDANCMWTENPKVAIKIIKSMEPHDLQAVEDPISRLASEDPKNLAQIRNAIVPLLEADAIYRSPQGAYKLLQEGAVDVINIDFTKHGFSYGQAKEVLSVTKAAGACCILGALGSESGVGSAALAHFAASSPYLESLSPYGAEILGPLWNEEDILKDPLKVEDGYLELPSGPGLGVEIDQERIERHKTREYVIT